MRIKPLKSKVHLQKVITSDYVDPNTGLFLPNQPHRDDHHKVLAVGPDCQDVVPGDTVLLHPTAPAEIIDGMPVTKMVEEKYIYAKIF
jgi:hypothetical protein